MCTQLEDYCTPNVAEILIREAGIINIDGKLGMIAASGEVTFSEFDESNMNLISFEDNTCVIYITKCTLNGEFSQNYLYGFKINEKGILVITDLTQTQEDGS